MLVCIHSSLRETCRPNTSPVSCFTVWCAVWRNKLLQPRGVLCSFAVRTSRFFILSSPESGNATTFTCPCSVSPSQVSCGTRGGQQHPPCFHQTRGYVLCLAESYAELYCFSFKPNIDEHERQREWDFLDLQADYSRMGLPNSLWKLSPVNRHHEVSEVRCFS